MGMLRRRCPPAGLRARFMVHTRIPVRPSLPRIAAALGIALVVAVSPALADVCTQLEEIANQVRDTAKTSRVEGKLTDEDAKTLNELAASLQGAGQGLANDSNAPREVRRLARSLDYAARDMEASLRIDPRLEDQMKTLDTVVEAVESLRGRCDDLARAPDGRPAAGPGKSKRSPCDTLQRHADRFGAMADQTQGRDEPLASSDAGPLSQTAEQISKLGARMASNPMSKPHERKIGGQLRRSAIDLKASIGGPASGTTRHLRSLGDQMSALAERCREEN